ncbi:MAG TPA: hypothetical protein VGS22_26645 [Thermoanaerobaculia bacterium]|nr:hypothetical protein [Thermoanaerobaculia bacterium]
MPASSVERELLRIEIEEFDEEGVRLARQALHSLGQKIGGLEQKFPHRKDWLAFVAATYGSFRDAPIERGPQGEAESRADLE